MSSALVWELVKGHNSFQRTGVNGTLFSAEAGNLYNKNSYKYSGLADSKNVDVKADGDHVRVSVGRTKNASNPKTSKHSVVMKRDAGRVNKAVATQIASYRADLKSAAVARASAVHKSIRAKKAKKSA